MLALRIPAAERAKHRKIDVAHPPATVRSSTRERVGKSRGHHHTDRFIPSSAVEDDFELVHADPLPLRAEFDYLIKDWWDKVPPSGEAPTSDGVAAEEEGWTRSARTLRMPSNGGVRL